MGTYDCSSELTTALTGPIWQTMKLLLHAFQLFCLTFFPLAKAELFLANVQHSKGQRVGEDYSMKEQLEERRENGSKSEEKSDDHIFHPSCLKNNTWLGAKVLSTKYDVPSPEDCHRICSSEEGCDAFTWSNYNGSLCFLYRQKDITEWTSSQSTNYASISYFISCGRLVCRGKPTMEAGVHFEMDEMEGPVKIGGRCPKQGERECEGKCQRKRKPCRGKCDWPLCRKGKKCLETLEGGGIGGRILRKACNGVCKGAREQCNGTCGEAQCWEEDGGVCLQPGFPGSEGWKRCGDKCIKVEELCNGVCEEKSKPSDKDNFCWDSGMNVCKSTEERNKDGSLVRTSCHCICHPYAQLCEEKCDRSQCRDGDLCLEELEKIDGKRVRTSCEGKCVPWGEKCVFY